MSRRHRVRDLAGRVDDRVSRWVVRQAPAPLVRRWIHLWAPLARYGGATRGGALVLSRALRLLTEPPRPLPASGRLSAAEIAQRIGGSEDDVLRWAERGLLGPPADVRPPQQWGPEGIERARLIDYLLHQGVSEAAMVRAAEEDRLPLLVVDLTLGAGGTHTAERAATEAGVSPEFARRLWRSLGLSVPDPGEPVYNRRDVGALRVVGALRAVYSDDELIESASVIGRALSQVASAQVELFRRHFEPSVTAAGSGDLEWALRAAALVDLIRRPAAALLELTHLRHLEAAARMESVTRVEAATGSLPGQFDATVGFADLVGFTAVSEGLSPLQVGELAGRLLLVAEEVMSPEVRLVKTIGDAVMFTSRSPLDAAVAAIRLIEAAAAIEGLPPLRAGVAHGPVLRRHGDYFGRTVNLAARLCADAPAGRLLLAGAGLDPGGAAAGLRVIDRPVLSLRGIDGPVGALLIGRADPVEAPSPPL